MNTPNSNIDSHSSHTSYPQVEALFQSLNISEQERKYIEKDFYDIAKIIYENPQEIVDNNIAMQIKLGETNRDNFEIKYTSDKTIVDKYINFIENHPNGVKIWRLLSSYYDPRKK